MMFARPVIALNVYRKCDECVDGYLVYSNRYRHTFPVRYIHKCTDCGNEQEFEDKSPRLEPSHAPAEQYEVDELLQAVAGDFRPGFCVFCQKPIEMNSRDFYASPWVANTESFRESNKVAGIYAHRGCVHARMPHLLTRKGKSPYYVKEAFNAY